MKYQLLENQKWRKIMIDCRDETTHACVSEEKKKKSSEVLYEREKPRPEQIESAL